MVRYQRPIPGEAVWLTAPLRDMSALGARFFSEHSFSPGALIEAQLILPVSSDPVSLKLFVEWVKPWRAGLVEVGVAFRPGKLEIQRLLAKAVLHFIQSEQAAKNNKTEGSERRTFVRTKEEFRVQYRISGSAVSPWCAVSTEDFSAAGIRFKGPDAIDPVTLLHVRVQFPGAADEESLRGKVVWSFHKSSTSALIGVEWLELTAQQKTRIDRLAVSFEKKRKG